MRFSFILEINSERFFLADVDKPVVKIPTSIFPESGSVADCLRASRCNLEFFYIFFFNFVQFFFGFKNKTKFHAFFNQALKTNFITVHITSSTI